MPTEPRNALLAELREHALVIGEVTLSSGQTAHYYVDAKRALLRPAAFHAAGELIAAEAASRAATAVGGMTMGARPARLRGDLGGGRGRSGRVLRPQGAKGTLWPAALDRGPGARARNTLPRRRGRGDYRRVEPSARSSASWRRATRWSGSPPASSTGWPVVPRRLNAPPTPPTGRWSRSTSPIRNARTATSPPYARQGDARAVRPGLPQRALSCSRS